MPTFLAYKMCWQIFDLFLFIFDCDNMGHGMWCWVPLMPVVMKFGLTHEGTLYEQFCDIESQWEKVSLGKLWAEVIQVMIWGHVKVLPIILSHMR